MSEYYGKPLKTTISTLKQSENLYWCSSLPNGLQPMFCRLSMNYIEEKSQRKKKTNYQLGQN